jgi:Na+/H+ antiporter NhaD/arsenite permease-like protein
MHQALGIPLWALFPFVLLLLAIAIVPLVAPHFWESNRNKGIVAGLLSLPIILYFVLVLGDRGSHALLEKGAEYVSFMCLLGSLFIVTGGIQVGGSLSGTPLVNTFVLALGCILSNLIGTTGASVLLIRPLLRANKARERKTHLVIFFIFVVSNCGGLLTPLGDPPLFLGFLKGVPFEWTLRLWRPWLLVNGLLLAIFHVWDQVVFDREERERPGAQLEEVQQHEPLRVTGLHNVGFLIGIVACIFGAGRGIGTGGEPWGFGLQEGLMLALAFGSFVTTSAAIRNENRFSFGPIVEVAVLFAGIFATMAPVLLYLNEHATTLGLTQPWQFFWTAGGLSSFLDNAPTYLTFAAVASGLEGVPVEGRYLADLLSRGPEAVRLLEAVSMGAVMMGANSYIGNGPNFMVKAIAEESRVAMPSFFGYMAYSIGILIPIFVLVTIVFLR